MRDNVGTVLDKVDLLLAELRELRSLGPHFRILHRFRVSGTVCAPGEEVADITLLHRRRNISVPLTLVLRQMFDYLARYRHFAQSASQIAAGMTADPFCEQHGWNVKSKARLRKTVSRQAVRLQMLRLRRSLAAAFRKAGLRLNAGMVIVSETTATNEVRYRLKAAVSWEHSDF